MDWVLLWCVHPSPLLARVAARMIGNEKKSVYNWFSVRAAGFSGG